MHPMSPPVFDVVHDALPYARHHTVRYYAERNPVRSEALAVTNESLDQNEGRGMFALPNPHRRSFASWLDQYMTENDFSDVDIAFFTQLSKEAVTKWRKGRGPGLDKEHRYREALTTYLPMFLRFRDVCRNIRYTGKP